MKEIKAFKCNYCSKKLFTKISMSNHENICLYNPEKKACFSCENNDYGECFLGIKKKGETPIKNCEAYKNKE